MVEPFNLHLQGHIEVKWHSAAGLQANTGDIFLTKIDLRLSKGGHNATNAGL